MRDVFAHASTPARAPRSRPLPIVWILLASASPLVLLGTWLTPWDWLPALIGRGHPLVLHFPIALLMLVALLEAVEAGSRGRIAVPQGLILFIGTFTAILAAVSGYSLMRSEAVDGALVERHLIGGVAVASLAWLALAVQVTVPSEPRSGRRWGYRALLGALCAALGLAGHDGATLTHGEDYLTEHLPWRTAAPVARLQLPLGQPAKDWEAYAHVVAPILEVRCYSCHNSRNYKGRLVLDRWESLMQGGTTGPLLVTGQPEQSLLLERMLLPLDHKERMPPKRKPQPTEEEIALLRLWVAAGAPSSGVPSALVEDSTWLAAVTRLPELLGAAQHAALAQVAPEVDPAVLARERQALEPLLAPLRERFPGSVTYLSRQTADVRINLSLHRDCQDEDLRLLASLKEHLVWLDLSGTAITDAASEVLAEFSRLQGLRLNQTRISDHTVAAVATLPALESLSLFATEVTDASLAGLKQLPRLRQVYLGETRVTPEALRASGLPAVSPPQGAEKGTGE